MENTIAGLQQESILVVDFGGQYDLLIARRVRELGVYCEVVPYRNAMQSLSEKTPKGIIFTGGPSSVHDASAPKIAPEIFEKNIPILGICYGCQLMAETLGGETDTCNVSEYGKTETTYDKTSVLFQAEEIPESGISWMSHTDCVTQLPAGFRATASTQHCENAAFEDATRGLYAVQFHPEVTHTAFGVDMLSQFVKEICGCTGTWKMEDFADSAITQIRETVGNKNVILALSGGVDSTVCAALLSKAIGDQLTCIFVDHGFMRKNEGDEIEAAFSDWAIHMIRVDAADEFIDMLDGVTDPETKRKRIGERFIRVFEREAKKLGKFDFLAQGTIYPDVVESGRGKGENDTIKSHHNVGGLPDVIDFQEIIEPLRYLFKDEVRRLGTALGLPHRLVWRQPFPGPGLAIRIIGAITREKLHILREADAIFREEIEVAGLDTKIHQYFAVLTDMRSVGVMGDGRTYDYTLGLRGVTTEDFMTADFARIPYDVLERVSSRIIGEVGQINRVVYDVTSKPPATIEWE